MCARVRIYFRVANPGIDSLWDRGICFEVALRMGICLHLSAAILSDRVIVAVPRRFPQIHKDSFCFLLCDINGLT